MAHSLPRAAGGDWLYYKIYTGSAASGLEYLITEVVPKIAFGPETDRWFFLRYADEGGLHLRLRLKAKDSTSNLRPVIATILGPALHMLSRLPPQSYRPAIQDFSAVKKSVDGVIRVVEDVYEPEVGTFGDRGIEVAEQLFQVSSQVAINVLRNERAGEYSRKTLVPILMDVVRAAFHDDASSFWLEYSNYWLMASGAAPEEWRPRFDAKARALEGLAIPLRTPEESLPASAREASTAWRGALLDAVRAFEQLDEAGRAAWRLLAYTFVHLMNNRLGVMPIEEAYFAALLATSK